MKNLYEISTKELPWNKMSIKYHEFAKVIGIQYEIKPPRLCCLKLALMDESGRLTGKCFTVKYHDMPDVLDFFVLKQIYVTAMSRTWKTGNKFRCMIDDEWWIGEIINKSPASDNYPDSSFLCYEIKWKNGEKERMSPWDLEPIDPARVPEDEIESIPVLEEELTSILYKTIQCDWPYSNISLMTKNIVTSLTRVMELAIAEQFLVPVDINEYPTYATVIEYPIDLSTIKARFENGFYRRLIAAQFDIRCLATNAEKFNDKRSTIVKRARILTELCLRILRNCSEYVDVARMYHRLNGSYDSSESEEETETLPSTSKNLRVVIKKPPDEWREEARKLIETLWESEDSEPFRQPVDPVVYHDYLEIVKNPMDLGTVKEKLDNNKYRRPQQFCNDMKLIFSNSRLYTPNKRTRMYDITSRLSNTFEDNMKKIMSNWRNSRRKRNRRKSSEDNSDTSTTTSSGEDKSDISEVEVEVDSDNVTPFEQKDSSDGYSSDDSKEKITRTRTRRSDKVSTSTYQPRETRKIVDYKPYSSSSSSEEDDDEYSRKSNLRQRPARKKHLYESSSSASDSDDPKKPAKRLKRTVVDSDSSDKSTDHSSNNRKENNFISTVSSRGRVRKFTERAKALFRRK